MIRKLTYMLLPLCFIHMLQAQDNSEYRIIRSNLGSSGSSQIVVTSQGTYKISQSVGQASVIGTHSANGYILRQGYQQPATKIKATNKDADYNLVAKVYPNPFSQKLTITFNVLMQKNFSVLMYDVSGKIIYQKDFAPDLSVEIQLQDIESGTYFLKVASDTKIFNTKLIKI